MKLMLMGITLWESISLDCSLNLIIIIIHHSRNIANYTLLVTLGEEQVRQIRGSL
jgi:hypothetical protein